MSVLRICPAMFLVKWKKEFEFIKCKATFMPFCFQALIKGKEIPLRRLKVAILKFSLMYLVNNVHAATSGIQLPHPLKTAASSNISK